MTHSELSRQNGNFLKMNTFPNVVSVGGSGGLFVGASLLTFIELLYYFTLRPCGGGDEDDDEEKPLTANDID